MQKSVQNKKICEDKYAETVCKAKSYTDSRISNPYSYYCLAISNIYLLLFTIDFKINLYIIKAWFNFSVSIKI